MASSSLISTVNGYENYIQVHGVDEQVIDAMEEAARVAILTEKDVEYGLKVSARAKELTEQFIFQSTGGTPWDLEKYSFQNKVSYEILDKYYGILLLEAQNKVVDSAFQYLEKKREPKERFYMPRRKQFLKIGLIDALQGMIDDRYDILCYHLSRVQEKQRLKKCFTLLLPDGFREISASFIHTAVILPECTMTVCTISLQTKKNIHGMKFSQIFP